MMKYYLPLVFFIVSLTSVNANAAGQSVHEMAISFFTPLPDAMPGSEDDTVAQIALGKRLYFDTALSVNDTQSCNSCHNILKGGSGMDSLRVSVGALGKLGTRNTPATWNAGLHVAQFWDARVETLEQQAMMPIINPNEMAMPSKEYVVDKLKTKDYLTPFQRAFPNQAQPITANNISKSLAAFQRTLISKDRFDDFLAGDKHAINAAEKEGLTVFVYKGCVACHNGPLLGGKLIMKMGLVNPYPNTIDKGKAEVTGNPADNYFFKVPSLRDVLNTSPYFHDGAVSSIEQAIKDTGWHQLGIKLNREEVIAIKAFFKTLDNQARITEKDE